MRKRAIELHDLKLKPRSCDGPAWNRYDFFINYNSVLLCTYIVNCLAVERTFEYS